MGPIPVKSVSYCVSQCCDEWLAPKGSSLHSGASSAAKRSPVDDWVGKKEPFRILRQAVNRTQGFIGFDSNWHPGGGRGALAFHRSALFILHVLNGPAEWGRECYGWERGAEKDGMAGGLQLWEIILLSQDKPMLSLLFRSLPSLLLSWGLLLPYTLVPGTGFWVDRIDPTWNKLFFLYSLCHHKKV